MGGGRLTLKERFVHEFKFEPKEESLAKLEAGRPLNYAHISLTIRWQGGKFVTDPYAKPAQSVDPSIQSNAPTPKQKKAAETQLQPDKAVELTTRMAPRKEDLERIARASKTTEGFTKNLKAEGIHREKNSDGVFVYGPQKQLWAELVPGSKGPGEYFIKETQQQSRGPRMG